jgi:hypothetical protein
MVSEPEGFTAGLVLGSGGLASTAEEAGGCAEGTVALGAGVARGRALAAVLACVSFLVTRG